MRIRKLRILYIGYSLLPISERSCWGAEQVLLLVESQMHRRGHSTVVAACSGSRVAGELFATGDPPHQTDSFEIRDAEHISRVLKFIHEREQSEPFDLIHDHGGSFWRHAAEVDAPVLATLHLPRSFHGAASFHNLPPNLAINCVSHAQARQFLDVPNVVAVVRNGVAAERFPFSEKKENYLLWMGRICEEKGAHIALDVAHEVQMPIVIVGEVYPFSYHQAYFQREVIPRLNRMPEATRLVGGISFQEKLKLLRRARAVLIPSLVDETSSLVAMEAMACGTPVVSLRSGALPEVVLHGSTGFVVETPEEMVNALTALDGIKPRACRAWVEQEFSASRVGDEYCELYSKLVSTHQTVEA